MGFTGLFLILFLIVHVGVNSCIFVNDNGQTFNTAAHFMSHNWVLRIIEIGLFAGLLLHIIQGFILIRQNNKARPIKYAVHAANENSSWYSRSMGILGTLLFLFLVMHIAHFFIPTKEDLYLGDDTESAYEGLKNVFSIWYWVVLYVLGVISLFWHLFHGFQSAFQTFGINHKRYTPIIKVIGYAYTIIVCVLFALMPVSMFFGWIS